MSPRLAGWIGVALSIAAGLFALAVYSRLPGSVPIHWGISGRPDISVAKPAGPFVLPAIVAVLSIMTWVAPAISPGKFRIEPFARVYGRLMLALMLTLTWISGVVFASALGLPVAVDRAALAGVGLLVVIVGNVLGKLTPNFFIGLQTPWTLASPEVWNRTHRLAGRLLVLAGLFLFAGALLGIPLAIPIVVLVVAAVAPAAYSYLLYRRLDRSGELGTDRP